MRFERSSGVLLHPTSLPGPFGIGDFGKEAHRFVDFLAAAGQTYWQIMPLGPPGYGGSPYASMSAFAGNVNLISPEELVAVGLLDESDVEKPPAFSTEVTDHGQVIAYKRALLEKAFHHFKGRVQGDRELLRDYEGVLGLAASWLDDYALFAALKDDHEGAGLVHVGARAGPPRARGARRRPARPRRSRGGPSVLPVRLPPPVARPQELRECARRSRHRRYAHLRRVRLGGRVVTASPVEARARRTAHGDRRRAARRVQRHRPALGQPDLRLEPPAGRGLRVVDRSRARDLEARGRDAPRPLSRVRGVLGGAGVRRDGGARRLGGGSRARAPPRDHGRARRARPADHRRGSRHHHARRARAARGVRLPRHARAPVRLERGSPRRAPAARVHAERRRLHRHARQRHGRRLVRASRERGRHRARSAASS